MAKRLTTNDLAVIVQNCTKKLTFEESKEIGEAIAQAVRCEADDGIEKIISKHENEQRCHYSASAADRISAVIDNYQQVATNSLSEAKQTTDDLITYMRAMVLVVEMAGNAQTHGEKNARLRGMVELMETAIHKLRDKKFNLQHRYYDVPDLFRSDYPSRQFIYKIRDLERQLEEANQANSKHAEKDEQTL